jgi:cobalt-precorrin-5B (C1)-methyltransferase
VVQAIDVARERGAAHLVLTTGGKSEAYAMRLYPALAEDAFVQVGDFVGVGLGHAARRQTPRVSLVGMIGKLSKMADGRLQTHAAGSDVNLELLATLAGAAGAAPALCASLRAANTARHVLELCAAAGFTALPAAVCARVAAVASAAAPGVAVDVTMVDFDGTRLAGSPGAGGAT